MAISLHNLKPAEGATKARKVVGRGGKRGTYSGRGMKGQRSRSGGKSGLQIRGFKQQMQSMPKLRGFTSKFVKPEVVNLKALEEKFESGATVDAAALKKVGLISKVNGPIKILGTGSLTKKLTVKVHNFSETAREAIVKAGGEAVEV